MTDQDFELFSDSLDNACRKAPRGPERDAANARNDAFGAELRAIQTAQRAADRGPAKVEELCRRYGWTP
jgi:hypothetical protein